MWVCKHCFEVGEEIVGFEVFEIRIAEDCVCFSILGSDVSAGNGGKCLSLISKKSFRVEVEEHAPMVGGQAVLKRVAPNEGYSRKDRGRDKKIVDAMGSADVGCRFGECWVLNGGDVGETDFLTDF